MIVSQFLILGWYHHYQSAAKLSFMLNLLKSVVRSRASNFLVITFSVIFDFNKSSNLFPRIHMYDHDFQQLVDQTRGKSIISISRASSANELRGLYDVANLFPLRGLSMERAKAMTSKNCRHLRKLSNHIMQLLRQLQQHLQYGIADQAISQILFSSICISNRSSTPLCHHCQVDRLLAGKTQGRINSNCGKHGEQRIRTMEEAHYYALTSGSTTSSVLQISFLTAV